MKAVFAVLFLLSTSCSTTSTIYTLDDQPIEAQMYGSDNEEIHTSRGRIRHDRVTTIDYPGNVHIIAGASIGGVGVLQTAVGVVMLAQNDPIEQASAQLGAGAISLGVGGGMMWWGWKTYRAAKRATKSGSFEKGPVDGIVIRPTLNGVVIDGRF